MRVRTLSAALIAATSFAVAAVPALAQDAKSKTVMITVENLTTGQPFSPSFFATRAATTAPLWEMGKTAPDNLVAVAEGGNIGGFSGDAAGKVGKEYAPVAQVRAQLERIGIVRVDDRLRIDRLAVLADRVGSVHRPSPLSP